MDELSWKFKIPIHITEYHCGKCDRVISIHKSQTRKVIWCDICNQGVYYIDKEL